MLELLAHLVGLLIQLLDLDLAGSNVTLELLDLVVKDEFELLKFLRLLLQIVDSLVFVADCCFTLLYLAFLRIYLLTERVCLLNEIIELLLLLMNVLLSLLLLGLSLFVVIGHKSQFSLALHASINNLSQFLLVLLLYPVNILPCLVFNFFSLIFMSIHESLYFLSQLSSLFFLLIKLIGVLLLKVLQDFLVMK